jgi:hypothetical protein
VPVTPEADRTAWPPAGEEAVADLLEEFAARTLAGEALDPEAFAVAHPPWSGQLRRVLPAVRVLAEVGRGTDAGPLAAAGGQVNGAGPVVSFRPFRPRAYYREAARALVRAALAPGEEPGPDIKDPDG